MDAFSAFDSGTKNMYAAARASASEALASMALLKNVPLDDEERAKAAEAVVSEMDLRQLHQLSSLDRDGLAARSRIINTYLDTVAIARILTIVMGIEGKDSLHDPVVQTVTKEIAAGFEAGLANKQNARWPPPIELAYKFYADRPRGPTVGRRDDGTVCTRWWMGFGFHRDPKEGPANIEVCGNSRREEYWFKGLLHRPPSQGPAVVLIEDGPDGKDARRVEEYWVHGKRHRPPEHGPAELIVEELEGKGTRRVEAYWFEGNRHRPHAAGPALITTHYKDNLELSGEEYFEHGKEHRPSNIGPAITQWDRMGRKVMELFTEEGELHRDPKAGPASFAIRDPTTVKETSENVTITAYCVRGQRHRDEADGPAAVMVDNVTGAVAEEYWRNGVLHRDGGPAIVDRIHCCFGGVLEFWIRDGKQHRDDGPAQVLRDGDYVFEHWYVDGLLHRDPAEGPAVITRDGAAGTVREEFWAHGERYPAEGPHSITRDRDGKVIEELFWDGDKHAPRHVPGAAQHALPETKDAEAGPHG